MIRVFVAAALAASCASASLTPEAPAADCGRAAQIARVIHDRVLPRWGSLSPTTIGREWPSELRQVGNGNNPVMAQISDACAVYFSFTGGDKGAAALWRVRILLEGARQSVSRDAPVLAAAFGPGWTRRETRELRDELETSTSWRVPANVEVAGVMHIRTVTLRQNPRELEVERQLWQLEVMYDRLNDAPIRRHRQPQHDGPRLSRHAPVEKTALVVLLPFESTDRYVEIGMAR